MSHSHLTLIVPKTYTLSDNPVNSEMPCLLTTGACSTTDRGIKYSFKILQQFIYYISRMDSKGAEEPNHWEKNRADP